MHETLSKLRKSRIPKSKYRQNKTYCLEIHILITPHTFSNTKEKQENDP